MKAAGILLLFDAALAALGLISADQGREVPSWSIFGALGLFGLWQVVLFAKAVNPRKRFQIEPFFRATHYVQAGLQATIYVYLSLYWPDVSTYAPLILAQVIVGYLCDISMK
ncbi:MAG: hypothetical protein HY290_19010 [Planctomycetia bacterium]|nr:hypothetical protein [Planctomycetia bacterium]